MLGIMLAVLTQGAISPPPQERQFRVWIEPVGRIPHQWRLKDDLAAGRFDVASSACVPMSVR